MFWEILMFVFLGIGVYLIVTRGKGKKDLTNEEDNYEPVLIGQAIPTAEIHLVGRPRESCVHTDH